MPWRPMPLRLKAVARCLLRLQKTPTQLQELSVSFQLLPKTLLGLDLILDLTANRANGLVKFEEEVVAKLKLAIYNCTNSTNIFINMFVYKS